MVYSFFISGAAFNYIIVCEVIFIVSSFPGKTSETVPPPMEAYDFWECDQSPIPYGQNNCVEIREYEVREKKPYATGCGWKIPNFCNDDIDAEVAREILSKSERVALQRLDDYTPSDYILYPGVGYYKIHTTGRTWAQAEEICAEEGHYTHLAVPNTASEYAAIINMSKTFLQPELPGIFIGISDSAVEGDFRTVFGQPLCTLQEVRWLSGEPNDLQSNEDCLGLSPIDYNRLKDYPCDQPLPFICEKALPGRLNLCEP